MQRAKTLEKHAVETYRQLCTVLANSDEVDDRRLAIRLAERLAGGREAVPVKEQLPKQRPEPGVER